MRKRKGLWLGIYCCNVMTSSHAFSQSKYNGSNQKSHHASNPFWKVVLGKTKKNLTDTPSTEQDQKKNQQMHIPSSTKEENSISISAPNENTSSENFIPNGYKLQDVPGDGLCGYWAILTAIKIEESKDEVNIIITRNEVREFLKKLSDQIAYIMKKQDKTDNEVAMICAIKQLIEDYKSQNAEELYTKIEDGKVQLDAPLLPFLAKSIGCAIVIISVYCKDGKVSQKEYCYPLPDNPDAKQIAIYYLGNGSNGHYRAIVPAKIRAQYH